MHGYILDVDPVCITSNCVCFKELQHETEGTAYSAICISVGMLIWEHAGNVLTAQVSSVTKLVFVSALRNDKLQTRLPIHISPAWASLKGLSQIAWPAFIKQLSQCT